MFSSHGGHPTNAMHHHGEILQSNKHHDETKKRAHDSQIVRAKENLKLSQNPITVYSYGFLFNCTTACLVLNPITVYSYGFLFNCTTVGQASDSMTALT